jgi:GTP-binding protein
MSDALDAAQLESGRLLFAAECQFVAAAAVLDRLPPATLTEIAFLGRSNVGKSSLINALTGRTTLARTSNTPGRTRQLNFFDLSGKLLLVDMPGYGYAEAPKTEIARWTELIDLYLKGRATLRRLILLVDSRHGVKENDTAMMVRLDKAAVSYQLVLTKIDKLGKGERERRLAETTGLLAKRPAAHPVVLATSAETGGGIPELRAILAALTEDH